MLVVLCYYSCQHCCLTCPDPTLPPQCLCVHAEASSEPGESDAATLTKQHLLVKAAPLAGMWAAERFGLADVRVLKLLEALPGISVLEAWSTHA